MANMRIGHCDIAALSLARSRAASHDKSLLASRRKRLGQFFTGLPLARLLAALSVHSTCKAVVDPMAGTGDLLDAVVERCRHQESSLGRMDAVEICSKTAQACRDRLSAWIEPSFGLEQHVHTGSAFTSEILGLLKIGDYDLVITNPPYVRYQTVANNGLRGIEAQRADMIRRELLALVDSSSFDVERPTWRELVKGYSGLSDLSVPSWLLSAMLVKPGGKLAMVAPATWRTRDYADVLQYLLARFFSLEVVVADRQPGWFSKALVRTHLVVAKRLSPNETMVPLLERDEGTSKFVWVEIDPEAQGDNSLVGAAFQTDDPEGYFAHWVSDESNNNASPIGIRRGLRHHKDENLAVLSQCDRSSWFSKVEPISNHAPLFEGISQRSQCPVPHALADAIPRIPEMLVTLEQLGIQVSQGLRTGCNDFFYVDLIEPVERGKAKVKLSALFGHRYLVVPEDVLVPVLRRQSEIESFSRNLPLSGRILNLISYILPENHAEVECARTIYKQLMLTPPVIMPEQLAEHVRFAALTHRRDGKGKLISELSAVRTNVRSAVYGRKLKPPRFWYMLPELGRRHMPEVFVPRINQRTPVAIPNQNDPIVIDANFSTAWSEDAHWTRRAITALLRSSWSRACMEAIGTPMGGGALKVEATHIRRLPMPKFNQEHIRQLAAIDEKCPSEHLDRIIIHSLFRDKVDDLNMVEMNNSLRGFAEAAEQARQRR